MSSGSKVAFDELAAVPLNHPFFKFSSVFRWAIVTPVRKSGLLERTHVALEADLAAKVSTQSSSLELHFSLILPCIVVLFPVPRITYGWPGG